MKGEKTMKDKKTLKIIVEMEYEPLGDYFGSGGKKTDNLQEMAKIDTEEFNKHRESLLDILREGDIAVRVFPVKYKKPVKRYTERTSSLG